VDAQVDPTSLPSLAEASLLPPWTAVLDHLPDAVFIIAGSQADGRIVYVNPRAERMFGYQKGELLDEPIELLVPLNLSEEHVRHRSSYAMAPQLRAMGAGLALRGRRRDGTEFPVDVLLNSNGDGPIVSTIAIVRDMTERKALEDALTEARDSAIKANEIKSRFLAAASHDLRQPLQTIWSLQAVLARALKETDLGPHLQLLEEAVRNMDQILSSLVDINRLEKGAIEPVIRDFPLSEIIPRLRSEFGYAASSKSLILEMEDSPEFARSDPMLLPVILRNLIGNAIKYTPHGRIRVRVLPDAESLRIEVNDTGPGIPEGHLKRLFEAFYQVDNPNRDQRQGVGLGLSIVQTICRILDHTVSIESRVGEGSTFSVKVPRGVETDRPAVPLAAPVTIPPARLRRAKVLHIEDDPGVAKSMALLLRLEGYEVVGAASREEALLHVEVHGMRPDLILSDFQLPMGFTGVEIVAEIAAILKERPPTIMLTGDIADDHVDAARAIADCILSKPVDINLLLREIETLLPRP
jgi:PAS domain S-box-containing protein